MKPVRLPAGESGIRKGNLTTERIEALAEYWGKPEDQRAESVLEFGKIWGLTAAKVREGRGDKRVVARVKEMLDTQLAYDVIEARAVTLRIMRNEKTKEDTRLKAARTIEQLAGNLSGSGPTINVTNDFSSYENVSDDELRDIGRREFGIE